MRRALLLGCLLALVVNTRAPAQSMLTLATVFPSDAQGLKPPYLEALWKYQQSPLSLTVNTLLTPEGWTEVKLSSEYKSPLLETSVKAELTPQEFRGAESKWKLTLQDWLALEGEAQLVSKGLFKNSLFKLKIGPSALNVISSAKLVSTGLVDERIALNFSSSFAQGNLSGSTFWGRRGLQEQTFTMSSPLADAWDFTTTSRLTLQGLKSQSLELSTRWEIWTLSGEVTIASQGPWGGHISVDGIFAEMLVQILLDLSGLDWTGLQMLAFGSWGSFSLDLIAMLSPDSLQMVNLVVSSPVWDWQAHVVFDLLWTDLSDIDIRANIGFSGEIFGFGIENTLSLKFYELLNASLRIKRALSRWTGIFYFEFSSEGFENGSFALERRWQL